MVVEFMQRFNSAYFWRSTNQLPRKLLHTAIPSGAASTPGSGRRTLPVSSQWERLGKRDKTIALVALGSVVVGGTLIKVFSTGMAGPQKEFPVLVIAGPSGSGKSTLLKKVFDKYPNHFAFSVSHTTRQPRQGESHGKEYFFTTREAMKKDIDTGKFIEWAEFSGNMYGTSVESVKRCQSDGKVCVLDIDMQGVRSIKNTDLTAIYVHIKPPSIDILEQRLRSRKTDTEEAIRKRLETARGELEAAAEPGVFDYVVLNDDLETAFKAFRVVLSERFGVTES